MTFTGQNDMELASALGCAELLRMPGGVLDDVGELDSMSGSPSATVVSRGSWLCARVAVGSKNVARDLGSGGGSSEIG